MIKSPLLFWMESNEKFVQIKDFANFYGGCNSLNHIGQAQFVISDDYDQYQRVLFSLIDFLVQVGGSFNSLRAIGFLITAVFSYRLLYASMIRALFFFDTSEEEWKKQFKKAEKKFNKKYGKKGDKSNMEAIDYINSSKAKLKFKTDIKEYSEIEKIKLCSLNDSSASEYSEHNDPEADVDDYSLDKRLGYNEIKDKMLDKLGYKTLKYDYKSFSIFKSLICCHILKSRQKLLKNNETRKLVLFNKGMERLDKEIDIVEMVKKFRKLDVIVRFLLKKDQQLLLDLKNTHYISSNEESEKYVIGLQKKKVIKKHKLLQRYIDNIKSKELSEKDVRLLKVLEFNDVLHMLQRPAKLAKINSEWAGVHPSLGKSPSFTKLNRNKKNNNSPSNKSNRDFMKERKVKFKSETTDSDDVAPNNIYRSRKNLERRRLKKLNQGQYNTNTSDQDLKQSVFYHELNTRNYNSRERTEKRKHKIPRYGSQNPDNSSKSSYKMMTMSKKYSKPLKENSVSKVNVDDTNMRPR